MRRSIKLDVRIEIDDEAVTVALDSMYLPVARQLMTELQKAVIHEVQFALEQGILTSTDVVKHYP
jgi:hypothetical protein